MNKTEFLNELEKRIRVLNKNEINDILAEYSQHIDMRRESGLSEDEAIKDFGELDELVAEILEAYHVNPEYSKELSDKQDGIGKKAEALAEEITSSVKGPLKSFLAKCKELIIKFFHWIKEFISKITASVKGFKKNKSQNDSVASEENTVNSETDNIVGAAASKTDKKRKWIFKKKNKKSKNDFSVATSKHIKNTKGRCRKLIGGFLAFCVAVIAILCLIPTTIAMLFSVFGLGISFIMMFAGYPIFGFFIMLLGASVASVALWLILATFIFKGDKKAKNTDKYDYEEVLSDKDKFVYNNNTSDDEEIEYSGETTQPQEIKEEVIQSEVVEESDKDTEKTVERRIDKEFLIEDEEEEKK